MPALCENLLNVLLEGQLSCQKATLQIIIKIQIKKNGSIRDYIIKIVKSEAFLKNKIILFASMKAH